MSVLGYVVKNKIPWWLKLITKIILSRIPVGYQFWHRLGIFRHGYMDQGEYVLSVFTEHVSKAGFDGKLQGKTVLEMGPGDSIATALIASCYGARSILVDAGLFAKRDIVGYKKIAEFLKHKGLNPPDISNAQSLDDVLSACDAIYITNGLEGLKSIKANTVDLVFSQAVLEHVRKHEFLDTLCECLRVQTVGGVASHRIDLKDHLGGSLNNLRFSNVVWESDFFVRSGFYTNRIRFSEMQDLFAKAGYLFEISGVRSWKQLPVSRKVLSNDFINLSDDDLVVSGFDVVLRKSG